MQLPGILGDDERPEDLYARLRRQDGQARAELGAIVLGPGPSGEAVVDFGARAVVNLELFVGERRLRPILTCWRPTRIGARLRDSAFGGKLLAHHRAERGVVVSAEPS